MKNILKAVGILFVVTSTLTACVNGKGDPVTQTFGLNGFTKLDHGIKGDVVLVKDDNQFVEVTAQQNIMDILDLSVSDGTLKLRTKKSKSIGNFDQLKFVVHAPLIENVKIGGAGTVTGGDGISGSDFRCRLAANGRLELTGMDVTYTEIIIAGAGVVKVQGTADKSDLGVGSSGAIEAFELSSDETNAQLKGNGSIQTRTNVKLNAILQGSGGIYYKGNPTVTSQITGNGILLQVP